MTTGYTITPEVDQAAEFLEIARDFTAPLEAVREAISNAFDAGAKRMRVLFQVESRLGEGELVVVFEDDGEGMTREGLKSFFDLGNSLSRTKGSAIGQKGHGTKVFFGCDELQVETIGPDRISRRAKVATPLAALMAKRIPTVSVEEDIVLPIVTGTRITLRGFNRSRREMFTHEQIKDYVRWFTKFGAIDLEFGVLDHQDAVLEIQGVDRVGSPEVLQFGHVFGSVVEDRSKLFDLHMADAPKYFCRRWQREGTLRNHPELKYQAVFYIEGDSIKKSYNQMITRPGRKTTPGMYQAAARYGLYLCKDFIPIERTRGWLGTRSTDHLPYHAFLNCQGIRLTANRSSVANTPQPILDDIREVVELIRREIIGSDEYADMAYLEQEARGYDAQVREEQQYAKRMEYVGKQEVADYQGCQLIAPRQESGVYALTIQLLTLNSNALPFEVIDYETSVGIDALVKTRDKVPISLTNLRYAEFKYLLQNEMNHSFKNLYCVIAWDAHHLLKHESVVEDVARQRRQFTIVPPEHSGDRTRYFLETQREPHKIEVFLLKRYLQEVLKIEFGLRGK